MTHESTSLSGEHQAAPSAHRSRSTARVIIVGLVSAWAVFFICAGIWSAWSPPGDFGIAIDADLNVVGVAPGSAADRAGIKAGDRIDERLAPPGERFLALGMETPPGGRETIRILRGTTARVVTLEAKPVVTSSADRAYDAIAATCGLLFVVIGTIIVFLRPSRMTWAFFLFCVGLAPALDWSPYWMAAGISLSNGIFYTLLNAAGWVGLLVFATRFPRDQAAGWWRFIDQAAPVIFAAMAVERLVEFVDTVSSAPTGGLLKADVFSGYAIYVLSVAAFIATYRRSRGDERQRVRWVIIGVTLGLAFRQLGNILGSSIFFTAPPQVFALSAWIGQLVIPFSVAYAVIRYRVLDITFAINRALVYGVLTSLVVATFALVDWFFVRKLVSTSAGLAAEVFVALAIGFWLNALHDRVNWFIDRTFFRRRYLAEQRLKRTAVALPHAPSIDVLNSLIVEEPLEALDLSSAAIFQRTAHGTFARVTAIGWPDESAREFTQQDRLVVHLESDPAALRTRDIRWARSDLPRGLAHPALALPILVRRQLAAIVLYGEPKSGAALDPDEVRAIGALATAAGAAYDHLEVDALRKQVADLQLDLARA